MYASYQRKTKRLIPLFVLEPVDGRRRRLRHQLGAVSAGAARDLRLRSVPALDLLGREAAVVVDEVAAVLDAGSSIAAALCVCRGFTISTAWPSRTACS